MQDRYAGDIGDFGKFSLLRALSADQSPGIAWYAVPSESHNNDGRHVGYLGKPASFRPLDPVVFDALGQLISSGGERSIARLEALGLLPGAVYHRTPVPSGLAERRSWFRHLRSLLRGCGLVFLDPDNGIAFSRVTPKAVALDEIHALLADGHALLVYHHQGRLKGGAPQEYRRATEVLRELGADDIRAVRLRPYSSRFYFLLNGSMELRARLHDFARHWGRERAELFAAD